MSKRVAVLYGGISAEREVSLSSGQQCIAVQLMTGNTVIDAFLQNNAGTLTSTEQHRRCFGVVVQTFRPPVIHDHAKIKIVGIDNFVIAVLMTKVANALFDVLAFSDNVRKTIAQCHR